MMSKANETTVSSICWNIAGSTACWTALYLALSKSKIVQQSPEFFCRIVTVAHALTAITLSAGCHWQGPNPYKTPGQWNTPLQDVTLVVSLGYFLFDLTWCLYHQTETIIMIVHHVASVVSISTVLFERSSGAEAVAGILSLELTNPLLQLRWFLRTAGYNRSLMHTAVEMLFVGAFLFLRLGFGTALTYSVVTSSLVKKKVKLCSLSLYLISLAFIAYILQFIKKKYTNKKITADLYTNNSCDSPLKKNHDS